MVDPEDVIDLVEDIADIVFLENGGSATDWTRYPIEHYRLFCFWRRVEKDVKESRERRIDALAKGWLK